MKAHGIRGEVAVEELTPHQERFSEGEVLYLSRTPDGSGGVAPATVEASRAHKGRRLLKLNAIADRTTAEQRAGWNLLIPQPDAEAALTEDEFFLHALIGREVRSADGRPLGEILNIIEGKGPPLLEIGGGRPSRMLPFVRPFVLRVDEEAVIVDPPAGWEEL